MEYIAVAAAVAVFVAVAATVVVVAVVVVFLLLVSHVARRVVFCFYLQLLWPYKAFVAICTDTKRHTHTHT